ncbi:MAG: glycosyltransferase family 61 protein [Cyanobacteriota bacterium]|nr:glycosyltransferase family 61 protein [Cyanobacteriota bacterium]
MSADQGLNYAINMRNLWDLPLERLDIYCQPFSIPEGYLKVSPQASCIGPDCIGLERHLAIIEETIPFRILNAKETGSLIWRCLKGPLVPIEETVCVLIDYLNIKPNYFHWFLDALPRILAAEAYNRITGDGFKIVVPQTLTPWQRDSLTFLDIPWAQMIRIPLSKGNVGWSFERLITSFSHRHTRYSPTGHFDALSPSAISALSQRLITGANRNVESHKFSKRIYVSRGNAHLRQVRNEEAIMTHLSRHDFELLHLDEMPLQLQILRFQHATHVISAHGAALTNLMYLSPGCQVLEIFQQGHGIRPDFFQLVGLREGHYSFAVVPSINAKNDIEIPVAVLSRFLEATL